MASRQRRKKKQEKEGEVVQAPAVEEVEVQEEPTWKSTPRAAKRKYNVTAEGATGAKEIIEKDVKKDCVAPPKAEGSKRKKKRKAKKGENKTDEGESEEAGAKKDESKSESEEAEAKKDESESEEAETKKDKSKKAKGNNSTPNKKDKGKQKKDESKKKQSGDEEEEDIPEFTLESIVSGIVMQLYKGEKLCTKKCAVVMDFLKDEGIPSLEALRQFTQQEFIDGAMQRLTSRIGADKIDVKSGIVPQLRTGLQIFTIGMF